MTTTATDAIWFIDNLARVRVDGETSGGELAIVELEARRGDMPPLHVHTREHEAFVVLEGELSLHLPGRMLTASTGETVLAPRGVPHAYRVESEHARWLAVCTPARFDEVDRELGEPAGAEELPPEGTEHDVARIGEIAARYGIDLLGPPGATP
jgi:quercetin dioxygenase-like cupin family protein